MGFGSYDESEQDNQEINTEEMGDQEDEMHKSEHDGEIEFQMDDTESAIERLHQMRDEDEEEEEE